MGKNLISKGAAVVRKMVVTEDLTVSGNLNLTGDLSLDDITLADSVTVTTLAASTGITTGKIAIGGGSDLLKVAISSPSVNFAEIADGATGTATVTVTGAKVGDAVIVNPPALEAGLIFNGAAVTAANTVTIYLTNVTAAPIDPAAATYRLVWLKFVA